MEVPLGRIPGVQLIRPPLFADSRGFFSELYNVRRCQAAGIEQEFVQDNYSFSSGEGTVRGLHFQVPPRAQAKLVIVLGGRILDVVVDLRVDSPTYRDHVKIEASYDDWTQIFVPEGCAHGFCTLSPTTVVLYKVSDYYAPEHDGGVHWQDPDLAIDWPVDPARAILSEKDAGLPQLAECPADFRLED